MRTIKEITDEYNATVVEINKLKKQSIETSNKLTELSIKKEDLEMELESLGNTQWNYIVEKYTSLSGKCVCVEDISGNTYMYFKRVILTEIMNHLIIDGLYFFDSNSDNNEVTIGKLDLSIASDDGDDLNDMKKQLDLYEEIKKEDFDFIFATKIKQLADNDMLSKLFNG
jgi:hypothetical protein